jgi:hypothetical protein
VLVQWSCILNWLLGMTPSEFSSSQHVLYSNGDKQRRKQVVMGTTCDIAAMEKERRTDLEIADTPSTTQSPYLAWRITP